MNQHAQINSVKQFTADLAKKCKTIGDVEDIMKEAGFTNEARKVIISVVKQSRRDADTVDGVEAISTLELTSQRLELMLSTLGAS